RAAGTCPAGSVGSARRAAAALGASAVFGASAVLGSAAVFGPSAALGASCGLRAGTVVARAVHEPARGGIRARGLGAARRTDGRRGPDAAAARRAAGAPHGCGGEPRGALPCAERR